MEEKWLERTIPERPNIASTEGNQSVPGHEEIKIGLNVYTK